MSRSRRVSYEKPGGGSPWGQERGGRGMRGTTADEEKSRAGEPNGRYFGAPITGNDDQVTATWHRDFSTSPKPFLPPSPEPLLPPR